MKRSKIFRIYDYVSMSDWEWLPRCQVAAVVLAHHLEPCLVPRIVPLQIFELVLNILRHQCGAVGLFEEEAIDVEDFEVSDREAVTSSQIALSARLKTSIDYAHLLLVVIFDDLRVISTGLHEYCNVHVSSLTVVFDEITQRVGIVCQIWVFRVIPEAYA